MLLQKKQNLTEILDEYKNFEGNPAPELASKFLNITNKINNIKQDNMNEFGQVSNEAKNLINELRITQKNIQEAYKIKLSEEDIMQGLNVNELDALRKELRDKGILFKITKNRITKIAIKDTPKKDLEKYFVGPTAAAISSDPISTAKILTKFGAL